MLNSCPEEVSHLTHAIQSWLQISSKKFHIKIGELQLNILTTNEVTYFEVLHVQVNHTRLLHCDVRKWLITCYILYVMANYMLHTVRNKLLLSSKYFLKFLFKKCLVCSIKLQNSSKSNPIQALNSIPLLLHVTSQCIFLFSKFLISQSLVETVWLPNKSSVGWESFSKCGKC